jgi:hypothetical protein
VGVEVMDEITVHDFANKIGRMLHEADLWDLQAIIKTRAGKGDKINIHINLISLDHKHIGCVTIYVDKPYDWNKVFDGFAVYLQSLKEAPAGSKYENIPGNMVIN